MSAPGERHSSAASPPPQIKAEVNPQQLGHLHKRLQAVEDAVKSVCTKLGSISGHGVGAGVIGGLTKIVAREPVGPSGVTPRATVPYAGQVVI
ncbi:MAG: hypothetical protein JOZ15_18495 [Acidobacteria bacterium]|nr:hypothetical protein [Acidobacteriota bacterium]